MNQGVFGEKEIPYSKLEKLGITRRSLLSMPKEVLEPLMSGRITPLLQTHYRAANGKVVSMPMKLQLQRDEDGSVMLMTYQVRKKLARGSVKLNNKEIQQLRDGDVL